MVMILLSMTYLLGAITTAILVGLALGAVLLRRGRPGPPWIRTLGLIAVFALLDTYVLPVVWLMDLSVTIGNADVARMLGTTDAEKLTVVLAIRWYHALIWLFQMWIARR